MKQSGSGQGQEAHNDAGQRVNELSRQLGEVARQLERERAVRRRLEEEVKEKEQQFRAIADFSYNWEYWIDPQGKYIHISPSCERITGYSADDFRNNPGLLVSIVHEKDRQQFANHLREEINDSADFHFNFRILTKDGEERWLAHSCRAVPAVDGSSLGRRASNHDITRQKRAEDKLQEREKFFRMVLDATSNGVWDRNLQTGEVYYGENWARMLGYTADEVIKNSITWEQLLHPDDKQKTLAAVHHHLQGSTSRYVAEFRMRNKAGEWQWVLARGKVVEWDENGRPLRFVGTHYDISDQKRVEDDLKDSSKKIKEFAYSVVHDLKNPAISIHGLTKHMRDRCGSILDEKGKKFCEQILHSSEQIAALVDKINIFISSREVPLFLQKVSLAETLAIIREEFSIQLDLRAVKWIAPESPPDMIVDRMSLLRVLRNFVDNALKYGGEKLSEIEVGYVDSEKFHILSVRDNGIGLAQEDCKGIFSMFKRKKNSMGIAGTGLGLAIVKEIAAQHGGEVWLEHGRKQGITFFISFAKVLHKV